MKIRRALISVYDKTGIVDFARALHDEFGVEIISTGGTAKVLTDAGIPVTLIETITGFPEMLDGRVKTLHPKIHAAILADRDNPDHMRQLAEAGIEPMDMVVVNLYPFEKTVADPNCTFEQAIEMIDIGGVALLRAAAKNCAHVWALAESRLMGEFIAVCRGVRDEPALFGDAGESGMRRTFAGIALRSTSSYDHAIQTYLTKRLCEDTNAAFRPAAGTVPEVLTPFLRLIERLRYGENSTQVTGVYRHGKRSLPKLIPHATYVPTERGASPLSYNNYLDADASLSLCAELTRAQLPPTLEGPRASSGARTCVFIKHTNPCGVGISSDPIDAYRRAYLSDPNAAMGGILAVNFDVTPDFAATVMETFDRFGKPLKDAGHPAAPGGFFVEVWLAPSFHADAVAIIRGTAEPTATLPNPPKKKWGESVRLLAVGDMSLPPDPNELQYRSIAGGMLIQTPDLLALNEDQWKVVTARPPTDGEMADLRLAWLIAKHTKSNAISIVKDGMLIGNGAGQMSRVMSCRIATWLANENGHADKLPNSAAASDAFFPFRDGPQILIDTGVTAIIQPGGSKRDDETIAACNERNVAMIFTGTRHFKH